MLFTNMVGLFSSTQSFNLNTYLIFRAKNEVSKHDYVFQSKIFVKLIMKYTWIQLDYTQNTPKIHPHTRKPDP